MERDAKENMDSSEKNRGHCWDQAQMLPSASLDQAGTLEEYRGAEAAAVFKSEHVTLRSFLLIHC